MNFCEFSAFKTDNYSINEIEESADRTKENLENEVGIWDDQNIEIHTYLDNMYEKIRTYDSHQVII